MGVLERLRDHRGEKTLAIKARGAERSVVIALDFLREVISLASKNDRVPVIEPSPRVLDFLAKGEILLENIGRFRKQVREAGRERAAGLLLQGLDGGLDVLGEVTHRSSMAEFGLSFLRYAIEKDDPGLVRMALSIIEKSTGVKYEKPKRGEFPMGFADDAPSSIPGLDTSCQPNQSPCVAMDLLRFAWEHQDSTLIKFALSILEAQTGVKCEKVPPGEHVL